MKETATDAILRATNNGFKDINSTNSLGENANNGSVADVGNGGLFRVTPDIFDDVQANITTNTIVESVQNATATDEMLMEDLIPIINETATSFIEENSHEGSGNGMEVTTFDSTTVWNDITEPNIFSHHKDIYKESTVNIVLYVICAIFIAILLIVTIIYGVAKYKKKRCHNLYNISTNSEQQTIDQSMDQQVITAYKC